MRGPRAARKVKSTGCDIPTAVSYAPWASQTGPLHRYSFQDYLALEEIAGVRHEFLHGEIYARAGGTPEHAAMAAAIVAQLGAELGTGPGRVYSSDLRVRVLAKGLERIS